MDDESPTFRPLSATDGLREQTRLLVDLAKRLGAARGDLESALRRITEVAARALRVDRSSVWLYDESRAGITCLDLFETATSTHSAGLRLGADDHPRYFQALETERAIAASDALNDPRTSEFADAYLRPLGIGALLDAPIRIRGQMIGVLCNEHRGEARTWTSHEHSLAGTFADFTGLAIEAHEHHEQEVKSRRLESQLRQAQRLESMGLLAGGIAHDFNNLLVGILGNAGLALAELPADAATRPLIEDIRAAATRAAELAQEMLAYSGRATISTGDVDLNALIEEMLHLVWRPATRRAELELHLDRELPPVRGDATQLRRVLLNLISNAADALGDEAGTVTISTGRAHVPGHDASDLILGERLADGDYVTLTIADSGHGMDAITRAHLFDPFFTTKTNGRGLGLAVVLGVVSAHHGAIRVESEPERGATITILLPASERAPAPVRRPPAPAPTPSRGSGTILVADDESIVRTVTRRVLQRAGYKVIEAEDGQAAIELFRAHRGELLAIVLDLTMPVVSGHEALSQIRALDPTIPVLVTSGFSEEALAHGITTGRETAFLQKPFNPTALISALEELCRSR
ncbi:MAG: response regulator [Myxococcales bacterium]|nr:response regulator [Myxococcales bacterium]MCB9700277.1 response regulator [Myxococcales bacterium]